MVAGHEALPIKTPSRAALPGIQHVSNQLTRYIQLLILVEIHTAENKRGG